MPDLSELKQVRQDADLIYSASQIEQALDQMAQRMQQDLAERDPIFLAVMNGGLVPMGLLLPRLDFPLRLDYCHASRYRQQLSGSELHWSRQPSLDLQDQTVVVVDDILDEGYTLQAVIEYCQQAGAQEVLSAVLLEKEHDRGIEVPINYIGLKVPDRYVFGYGLDYKGYWRNAPGIFALPD